MYGKWTASEDITVAARTMGYRPIEVYRYSEVLLIYAEAKQLLDQWMPRIRALNQVKEGQLVLIQILLILRLMLLLRQ